MGKGLRHINEDIVMANNHLKRCSLPLPIREMKSKTLVRFCFTPIDWRNLIGLLTPSVGMDEKEQEL